MQDAGPDPVDPADARLIAELRALPLSASPARTWNAIARAIAIERREAPVPWFLEAAALAAAGLLLATMLVRHSVPLAERLSRIAIPTGLAPWLLPLAFVICGMLGAAAMLPLLLAHGRPATTTHP